MRITKLFLPLIKENPREAQIVSHTLMLRSGMIRQVSAGIYNWLPLGLRVQKKVANIIREEMDKAGAQEITMPTVQPADLWKETGRYDAYGKETLRMNDRHENELLYSPTSEDVVTDIFRNNVKSYKELPLNLYQINLKFRDEIRPRFGVMRGREFMMKDSYSFDLTKEEATETYKLMFKTYIKIYKRMGLDAIPMAADTGPIGGDLSHEFHIIADTGESEVFFDKRILQEEELTLDEYKNYYAATDEKHDFENHGVPSDLLVNKRGIEVGHIFYLGTKYTEALNATVVDASGQKVFPQMGCYGIGVSRLVGAIIEASHDENGIIWPESVAPFTHSIIPLGNNESVIETANKIYNHLTSKGYECLLDDSSQSTGQKFATHDLIGIPYQIIIGNKGLEKGVVELKNRKTGDKTEISINELLN